MRRLTVALILMSLGLSGAVQAQEGAGGAPAVVDAAVVAAPRPARIAGGVEAGMILKKVAPSYPESAKQKHITGSVVMRAIIDKTGKVENLTVVSGPEELRTASIKAVSKVEVQALSAERRSDGGGHYGDGELHDVRVWFAGDASAGGAGAATVAGGSGAAAGFSDDAGDFRCGAGVRWSDGGDAGDEGCAVYSETDAAGTVVLIATIGKDGSVAKLEAFSGPAALRAAALEAVRQWHYRPYLLNGKRWMCRRRYW